MTLRRRILVCFTLCLCALSVGVTDLSAAETAIRLGVSQDGFGRGPSAFVGQDASVTEESYAQLLAAAASDAGVVVRSEADVTLQTWLYRGAQGLVAALRLVPSGSQEPWVATVSHPLSGGGRVELEDALDSVSETTMKAVAQHLAGRKGFPKRSGVDSLASLGKKLRKGPLEQQLFAIQRLAWLADDGSVHLLVDRLEGPEPQLRPALVTALAATQHPVALDALESQIRSETRSEGYGVLLALHALAELGGERSRSVLVSAASHPVSEVRAAAIGWLVRLGVDVPVDLLVGRLEDESEVVRLNAAIALASVEDPRGRDAISSLREGGGWPIRWRIRQLAEHYWEQVQEGGDALDTVRALKLAALLDHRQSQYMLGDLYLRGEHVGQDSDRALALLRQAADGGQTDAQYMLGYLHAEGRVVAGDPVESCVWFAAAAARGHENAAMARDRMKARLTPTQLAEMEERLEPLLPPDMPIAGTGDITNPRLLQEHRVSPRYPPEPYNLRREGNVILQAVIHADGSVGDLQVLRCNPPLMGFEEAALEAVSQWRYEPATQNGTPVDVYFTIFVEFKLH